MLVANESQALLHISEALRVIEVFPTVVLTLIDYLRWATMTFFTSKRYRRLFVFRNEERVVNDNIFIGKISAPVHPSINFLESLSFRQRPLTTTSVLNS